MKFKFQSFVDLQTSASSMQVIQWSVGGRNVIDRCRHLFGAYKYFKLGKISVKLVPASSLPVDPLGLSYAEDDPQTVDPRDQMNPGLVRITNGEDIFTNVSALSAADQEAVYNAMMLDPRWSKFMLQSGFRRTAYPLFWQVGQLSQDKYPGATVNLPSYPSGGEAAAGTNFAYMNASTALSARVAGDNSSPRGFFQVGHRGKLGFLPTDYYQSVATPADSRFAEQYGINNVPEVSVITCVLPKAFKTVYYYRCYITEEVIFAGIRSAPVELLNSSNIMKMYSGLDQFLIGTPDRTKPDYPAARLPSVIENNGEDMP